MCVQCTVGRSARPPLIQCRHASRDCSPLYGTHVFEAGIEAVIQRTQTSGPMLFAMFGLGPELVCANFLLSGCRPLTVFPTVFLSPVTTGSGTLQDSLRPYCGLVRLGGDDRWGRRLALLISGRFSGGRGFCSRLRSHQNPPGVFFLI